jgi:uncharacterized membrane protein
MSDPNLPSHSLEDPQQGFRAILTPHRSLSAPGFLVLMCAVGFVSFVAGIVFLAVGAWPVLGFFGLDVVLIYVAFRLNYRSGRAFETVEIAEGALKVTRVDPTGRTQTFDFNPHWARVRLRQAPNGRADLRLTSHGRELSFGRFLTDDEKRDFAEVLKGALLAARGGARI